MKLVKQKFAMLFAEISKNILQNNSSLTLMVSRENDQLLRVVVVPVSPDASPEHAVLKQPLHVVETPENLDAHLGTELAAYQEARQEMINSLTEAAAVLKEEAKNTRQKTKEALAKKSKDEAQKVEAQQAAAKAVRTGEQLPLATAETATAAKV